MRPIRHFENQAPKPRAGTLVPSAHPTVVIEPISDEEAAAWDEYAASRAAQPRRAA